MRMLVATPTGMFIVPTTFSIRWSAVSAGRLPVFARCARSSSERPAYSATAAIRSARDLRWKPAMRLLRSVLLMVVPSASVIRGSARHHHARQEGDDVRQDDADKQAQRDRKSTRLNSSHVKRSYAVFCLKTKKTK